MMSPYRPRPHLFSPTTLLLGCGLLLPSLTAQGAEPPKKPKAEVMEEEVIVTGRRDGEPDFQERQDYHNQEYRRLKEIYEPDPPVPPRMERLTRMPEAISTTVQGKPTLTEKYW
ncbi:hypothetical protein [Niveispirillum irakense]|uniref:hypothetical protein n=1 Tax=Niveispirillum irakense TaxID=34011 RepID=UPI00048A9B4D|nr:hypothetical protein [Niveispirillum irakense]